MPRHGGNRSHFIPLPAEIIRRAAAEVVCYDLRRQRSVQGDFSGSCACAKQARRSYGRVNDSTETLSYAWLLTLCVIRAYAEPIRS